MSSKVETESGAATKPELRDINNVQSLEQRLAKATERRDLLQNKSKEHRGELDRLLAKIPRRPREKLDELEQQIAALERERTINSIELAQEREILKQISRVEKQKRQVVDFEEQDKRIKAKKSELSKCVEELKLLRADVEALRTELQLAKTANQVGCAKEELLGSKVECPPDKLGQIIGKKGKNVKQLMEKASVKVDVVSKGEVRLIGAIGGLDAAAQDLDKVIQEKDETIDPPPKVVEYLTSKNITALEELRRQHPNVKISVQRKSSGTQFRGPPSDIDTVKKAIDQLASSISSMRMELPALEAAAVVGKSGETVEGLVLTHQVVINVEREDTTKSVVEVIGLPENVQAAVDAINVLTASVRESSRRISVDPDVKTALLLSKGVGIKEIQRMVNENKSNGFVSLNFEGNEVVLKGREMRLDEAAKIAQAEIDRVASLVVRIEVDPAIVSAIIGKGGEVIKKICDGKAVNIETDNGISIVGCNLEEVNSVENAVRDIISLNHVERINVDAAVYSYLSRDLIRGKSKAIKEICNLTCDDNRCDFVLRGEPERVKEASDIVREFIRTNYKEEIPVTADDLQVLLAGGKSNKLVKVAEEHGVKIHSVRGRSVVEARGERSKVEAAINTLKIFLFGGEGFSAKTITLEDELLGFVIGKGGKNKADLEKKFGDVTITVDGKRDTISLRGPEKDVEDCHVEIMKRVASATITKKIQITEKDHAKLNKGGLVRSINRQISVQISITKEVVTLRGLCADVLDAASLLNYEFSGKYESRVVIESSSSDLFQKVAGCCEGDSSHLSRIMKESGCTAAVDSSDGSIVLRGNRDQVRAGKVELYKFFEFLLASGFARLEFAAPLLSAIGRGRSLPDAAAVSGAFVRLDRDTCSVLVFSSKEDAVMNAVKLVKSRIEECEKLMYEIKLEPSEGWLVSSIVGKGGSHINDFRKKTKCNIGVDSEKLSVSIKGETPEEVQKARAMLEKEIEQFRKQCVVLEIPDRDMPSFVGKSGAHITEFEKTHSVKVDVRKDLPGRVRITGEESAVTAAKEAVEEWMKTRADARVEAEKKERLQLRKDQVPTLIGTKGTVIQAIQKEFGCRVDVDRVAAVVTVSRGSSEKRAATLEKIQTILSVADEEGESDAVSGGEEELKSEEAKTAPVKRRGKGRKTEEGKDTPAASPVGKQQAPPVAADFPVLAEPGTGGTATGGTDGKWVSVV